MFISSHVVMVMNLMNILEDIKVLDLTQYWFGPYCTMMLGDLGAEIIRIEPPWGSPDRLADAFLIGAASYTFHQLNLNKKGITLNLKTKEGIHIFKELVKKFDVVVQNFRPGTMEKLGLSYETMREINPKIIYAALSGFGQTGPYKYRPCFAPIAEAMSGHSRLTGDEVDPNGPPIEMAQAYGDLGPGLFAAMSIIAAIRHRDKTGIGQMIDVAQLDCMTALNMAITGYNLSNLLLWQLKDKYPLGRGFGGIFKTKDNLYIRIASFSPKLVDSLREYMQIPEISDEKLREKVSSMNSEEAVNYFLKAGVPVAPIYNVNDVVVDPHLIERDMFIEVEHSLAGRIKVVNFPVKFSETKVEIKKAAPTLSEDTEKVLVDQLGYTLDYINKIKKENII